MDSLSSRKHQRDEGMTDFMMGNTLLCLSRRFFFSNPATTRSTASFNSAEPISSRLRRAASKAASLITFAKSAPAKPTVIAAIISRFAARANETSRACRRKIASRLLLSGRSTRTCQSATGRKSAASSGLGCWASPPACSTASVWMLWRCRCDDLRAWATPVSLTVSFQFGKLLQSIEFFLTNRSAYSGRYLPVHFRGAKK